MRIWLTTGVVILTVSGSCDALNVKKITTEKLSLGVWLQGIGLLSVALVLSSLLGHVQEYGYARWGKDWKEQMFYCHLMSIPWFLFVIKELSVHLELWNTIPNMWVWIVVNVGSQYPINTYFIISHFFNKKVLLCERRVHAHFCWWNSDNYLRNNFTKVHKPSPQHNDF